MFSASARRWLMAAFFLGSGQQLFVVLRNQHLADRGLSADAISRVQGAGGMAGLVAGLLGLWLLRIRSRTALLLFAACNATGFAIQALATREGTFVLGAAIAGLGIQGVTMASAPLLTRIATEGQRVRLYATSMIALMTLPGVFGAALGGVAYRAWGYHVTLGLGALVVAAAVGPLFAIEEDAAPTESRVLRLTDPRRAARLLLPDALAMLAAGLSVPFLQIYFKETFSMSPPSVAWIYAATMLLGTLGHALSPSLVRRIGAARAIVLLQLTSAPLLITLALARSLCVAAPAFAGRQIATTAAQPVYASMLHGSVPDEDSGPVASYRMLVQSIVWAAGNFLAGPLIDLDGGRFRVLLGASATVMTVAAIVGFAVYPKESGT